MKRTLVIYQYPNAKGDVLRWAIDRAAHDVLNNIEDNSWRVYGLDDDAKPVEEIEIIPHNYIYTLRDKGFDKVVLYGAFEASFLMTVVTNIKGPWIERSQKKRGGTDGA